MVPWTATPSLGGVVASRLSAVAVPVKSSPAPPPAQSGVPQAPRPLPRHKVGYRKPCRPGHATTHTGLRAEPRLPQRRAMERRVDRAGRPQIALDEGDLRTARGSVVGCEVSAPGRAAGEGP